ncbi:hypothetical protein JCM5353_006842, partial [Sporobolomyces roseus]
MPTDRQPRAASQAAIKKMSPPAKSDQENNNKSSEQATTSKASRTGRPHPTYQEMILEAIEEDGDKGGASRPVIKKWILHRYGMSDTNQFDSLIAAAIRRGSENGTFDLPKGFTGKIKIAKDTTEHKENAAPSRSSSTAKKAVTGGTARTRILAVQANKAAAKASKKKPAHAKKSTSSASKPAAKKSTTKASTSAPAKKKAAPAPAPAAPKPAASTSRSRGGGGVKPVVEVPAKKKSVAAKSV